MRRPRLTYATKHNLVVAPMTYYLYFSRLVAQGMDFCRISTPRQISIKHTFSVATPLAHRQDALLQQRC